jgi:hypothetical protein
MYKASCIFIIFFLLLALYDLGDLALRSRRRCSTSAMKLINFKPAAFIYPSKPLSFINFFKASL